MTDEEWETGERVKGEWDGDWCSSLHPILCWVRREIHPSMRKLRLFACACCRRAWHLLPAEGREAVEVAERFADWRATKRERAGAYKAVARLVRSQRIAVAARHAVAPMGDGFSAYRDSWQSASTVLNAVAAARRAAAGQPNGAEEAWAVHWRLLNEEAAAMHRMLACLFLNPTTIFPFDPDCQPPEVIRLAQAASEERELPAGLLDNARLAAVAAALEGLGAASPILAHLRRPEAHFRGCWALDLVLNRDVPRSLRVNRPPPRRPTGPCNPDTTVGDCESP
jgi:hypothetical protein